MIRMIPQHLQRREQGECSRARVAETEDLHWFGAGSRDEVDGTDGGWLASGFLGYGVHVGDIALLGGGHSNCHDDGGDEMLTKKMSRYRATLEGREKENEQPL